jgi:hypothetical protein
VRSVCGEEGEEFGASLDAVISEVAEATRTRGLDVATVVLHRELSLLGVKAGDDWCRTILEKLRAGHPVQIDIESAPTPARPFTDKQRRESVRRAVQTVKDQHRLHRPRSR